MLKDWMKEEGITGLFRAQWDLLKDLVAKDAEACDL